MVALAIVSNQPSTRIVANGDDLGAFMLRSMPPRNKYDIAHGRPCGYAGKGGRRCSTSQPPCGYTQIDKCLVHIVTGVACWSVPLMIHSQVSTDHEYEWAKKVTEGFTKSVPDYENTWTILYHYTDKVGFEAIVSEEYINASTRMQTDCDFGVGIYATSKAPDAFTTKFEILYNNYPRATSKHGPGEPGFPLEDRVAFCIPVLTNMKWTPALPLTDPLGRSGPIAEVKDRYGDFDAARNNIWLIQMALVHDRYIGGGQGQGHEAILVALHVAIEQGQFDVVEKCIADLQQLGGCLDATLGSWNDSALSKATGCGDESMVLMLLKHLASPEVKDSEGRTALHLAVRGHHYDIAEILISAGSSVNAQDLDGLTCLHHAIEAKNPDAVHAL